MKHPLPLSLSPLRERGRGEGHLEGGAGEVVFSLPFSRDDRFSMLYSIVKLWYPLA
jgi:hypothetical protein